MKKICEWCGKQFETTSGTKRYCDSIHYDNCKVCGKQFVLNNSTIGTKERKHTCSRHCSIALRKLTNMDKYGGTAPIADAQVRNRMKNTMLSRYGTTHAMRSDIIKNKLKQTCLDRYGVESPLQLDKVKQANAARFDDKDKMKRILDKSKQTNLCRYGVAYIFQSKDFRTRAKAIYKEKTGYEYPSQNPDVRHKIEETNISRYGVKVPLQNEDIMAKCIATNLKRFGCKNPLQNTIVHNKSIKTNLEKYGFSNPMSHPDIRAKVKATMRKRYGKDWFSQTQSWYLRRMKAPDKYDEFLKFTNDPITYIQSNFSNCPSLHELGDSIGLSEQTAGQYVINNNLQKYVRYVYSRLEDDVYEYIHSLDSSIVIIRNTKRLITPYELDIYLPEYNFAIECNPTATHNSSVNVFSIDEKPISYNYHKLKTDLCEQHGIFLFHIFGYEWAYKQEVIKSMIRNVLGANKLKIYGRQCEVKEVSPYDARIFLNNNHRQGFSPSSNRLGLYYNNELVSLMTFGKNRITIGSNTDVTELIRFCNKLNTSVVGGASKLFKYYVNNYNPDDVVSYSDRAHTRGNLYEKLGFSKVRMSDPGYVWVNSIDDKAYNRMNAQKHNIKKFLNDDDIDLTKSERQIMIEHGFLQVFDSGTITWKWENTSGR